MARIESCGLDRHELKAWKAPTKQGEEPRYTRGAGGKERASETNTELMCSESEWSGQGQLTRQAPDTERASVGTGLRRRLRVAARRSYHRGARQLGDPSPERAGVRMKATTEMNQRRLVRQWSSQHQRADPRLVCSRDQRRVFQSHTYTESCVPASGLCFAPSGHTLDNSCLVSASGYLTNATPT